MARKEFIDVVIPIAKEIMGIQDMGQFVGGEESRGGRKRVRRVGVARPGFAPLGIQVEAILVEDDDEHPPGQRW